jgi:hypothetical protein
LGERAATLTVVARFLSVNQTIDIPNGQHLSGTYEPPWLDDAHVYVRLTLAAIDSMLAIVTDETTTSLDGVR